jgi:hypothetical protein
MQYADKRFQKDFHFMFQVFGVIQKHQVCLSTVLQVQKKAFHDNEMSFPHLTADDLSLAGRQEAKKETISNPVICALKSILWLFELMWLARTNPGSTFTLISGG